jgi:hypothetical protein
MICLPDFILFRTPCETVGDPMLAASSAYFPPAIRRCDAMQAVGIFLPIGDTTTRSVVCRVDEFDEMIWKCPRSRHNMQESGRKKK